MAPTPVVAGGSSSSSARPGSVLLAAVAGGAAVLTVTALPPTGSLVTTYAATSTVARVAGALAGVSLLAAGVLAAWCGPSRPAGALLVGAGLLWSAPDWAGWESGPALVRAVATLVAPLLPLALWGVLGSGGGRRPGGLLAVGVLVGAATVGSVAVEDPFLAPVCWPTCSGNALLVASSPALAEVLGAVLASSWALVGGVVVWCALRRLATASSVARRWDGALLGALALTGAAELVYGIATLTATETGESPGFRALHLVRSVAWSLLAAASAWATYHHWVRRRALAGLAAELETAAVPGTLAGRLRSLTADPDLDVWYPVDRPGRMVTADGRPAPVPPGAGRRATALRRGDQDVAVLVHDAALLPVDALDAVLGPAARLALENERLAAERLARLDDVRESQRRIVVAGDEARRRLERDLHDGAQQELLAVAYAVRSARAAADAAGDRQSVAELDHGLRQAQGALDDLRALGRGIHPAVLAQSGLAAALRSLAEQTATPLELGPVPPGRFDRSVELAAYLAVRDAATAADPRWTASVVVRAAHEHGLLVVEVDAADVALSTATADRIGALGGRCTATAAGMRVELPCGS
jgi:signal transduction histidine kinase